MASKRTLMLVAVGMVCLLVRSEAQASCDCGAPLATMCVTSATVDGGGAGPLCCEACAAPGASRCGGCAAALADGGADSGASQGGDDSGCAVAASRRPAPTPGALLLAALGLLVAVPASRRGRGIVVRWTTARRAGRAASSTSISPRG